jgi:hypothetical protein
MGGKGSEEDDDGDRMGESLRLFSSLSWHDKTLRSSQPFLPKIKRWHRSGLPRVSAASGEVPLCARIEEMRRIFLTGRAG